MAWVKLDDGFFGHPKVQRAGRDAAQLFLASLCYSSSYLTDGVVDKSALGAVSALVGIPNRVAKTLPSQLCNAGLWRDCGDHWEINDYLEYNPSRTDVESDRRVKHEAKVRAGHIGGIASGVARRKHNGSTHEAAPKQTASKTKPPPDPSPNDLQPPTTESRWAALNGRAGEVLNVLLATERTTSGPVKNRHAWEDAVTARLATEHGERIRRLVDEYPDAPPDVIAGQIVGDSNGLRYYTRRDTA
jgi:hypothetical protein